MRIGQLSKKANCKIETIRYYERVELLPAPDRSDAGYRNYAECHLHRLIFIRRSRELGFSIGEIRGLLNLVDGGDYTCGEVKTITVDHINSIRKKIADLNQLEKTLSDIAAQCDVNAEIKCPIIDALYKPQEELG